MTDDHTNGSGGPQDASSAHREHQIILDARAKGRWAMLGAYTKLSGPGWLQSAITLGGGTLTASLYLGVLGGFAFLWLQPVAMILGIVMLSAIGYVSLSVKERPFEAINKHVNPVLGWGWLLATMMANLVWSISTFAMATAGLRQNLLPGILGAESGLSNFAGNLIAVSLLIAIAFGVVWFYGTGRKGVKIFEIILKVMVGVIVVCFFGVVIKLAFSKGLDWRGIFNGIVPDLGLLSSPADSLGALIDDVDPRYQEFWKSRIVGEQRNVMIAAMGAAVGINMTVLLPYTMLQRGWNRDFRGLAVFDLSTGLFIPYLFTTACVIIAAATQFHAKPAAETVQMPRTAVIPANHPLMKILTGGQKIASARAEYELREKLGDKAVDAMTPEEKAAQVNTISGSLSEADRRLTATLVRRDAYDLAFSLKPFTGNIIAQYVFGIGVVGMTLTSGLLLMLINGFVLSEMFGQPMRGWVYRIGTLMPCIGILGPFVMGTEQARVWLMIPTSVFAAVVLPIAYVTFYLLMNQKSLLGDDMPRGAKRVLWNVLMAIAAVVAAFASFWKVWDEYRWKGVAAIAAFVSLAVVVHFVRAGKPGGAAAETK